MTTQITTTACSAGITMISSSQQHENFPDAVPCSPPHPFNNNNVMIIIDEDDDECSITSSITYNNEDSITYNNEDSKGVMPSSTGESTTTKSTANISKQVVDGFEYSNYLRTDCRDPVQLNYCPCCKHPDVMTTTKSQNTRTTAGLVCVGVLIFWPLAWMPLVSKSTKRIHHHCSECNVLVGQVQPTVML